MELIDTVEWSTTNDHAKWAISSDSGTSWVCLVDNNRCTSQYVRGGLAQCIQQSDLHKVLLTGTQETNVCDGTDDSDDDNAIDDTPASTCAEIGCGNYESSALCACNDQCEDYGDCCEDFEDLCGEGSDDDNDDKTDDDKMSDDSVAPSCCHYDDDTCNAGDVCCLTSCDDPATCSYTKSGCSGKYGEIHDCAWEDDEELCVVGNATVVA